MGRKLIDGNHLIDCETGEILREFRGRVRIIDDGQMEIIRERVNRKKSLSQLETWQGEMGGFIMATYRISKEFNRHEGDLTQSDITRLVMTATYMDYDGRLSYDNGRKIDEKGLRDVIGISSNKFKEFYERLLKLHILKESEDGLYINRDYFIKGDIKNIKDLEKKGYTFSRIYINTVRSLYKGSTTRGHKKLALIFRLIPHMNYQWNVACFNPYEKNEEEIRFMNMKELSAALGYSAPFVLKKELRKLEVGNEKVMGFFQMGNDGRENKIVMNPKVIYQGSNLDKLMALKMQFIVNKK